MSNSCRRCPLKCTGTPNGVIGRCGVVEVYDNKDVDKYPWMIADANIVVIEKTPFYHYKPGSWVLTLWVPGCPYSCRNCPWNAGSQGVEAEKVYELYKVKEKDVKDFIESSKAEIIHITGGEPLIHDWVIEFSLKYKEAMDVTLKSTLNVSIERIDKMTRAVKAVLVDIPLLDGFTPSIKDVVANTAYLEKRGVHVEVIASIGANILYAKKMIDKYLAKLKRDTPIHVAFTEPISDRQMLDIIQRIETLGFTYVYVKDDPSGEYSTTYCPRCGEPVVIRDALGLRRIALKNSKCPKCGYPIKIIGAEVYRKQSRTTRLFASGERLWRI